MHICEKENKIACPRQKRIEKEKKGLILAIFSLSFVFKSCADIVCSAVVNCVLVSLVSSSYANDLSYFNLLSHSFIYHLVIIAEKLYQSVNKMSFISERSWFLSERTLGLHTKSLFSILASTYYRISLFALRHVRYMYELQFYGEMHMIFTQSL